ERAWPTRGPARLLLGLGAAVLGLAMATAVWWPMVLYGGASVRAVIGGVTAREVLGYSLAPRDLAALAWPWAVGWAGRTYWGGLPATDYPQYAGVLVMAVVLLGMARRAAWKDGPTQ